MQRPVKELARNCDLEGYSLFNLDLFLDSGELFEPKLRSDTQKDHRLELHTQTR